ncbi:MAG: nicotinate (nicotinamide) nucleotide adenylyltransferase [Candidatus Margulisbacteria bacterium]|nr:nicotinate (nicotinamide) nucleotide adenylyltransferase [Candidatus Margulisiibacteriota bacterium]
MDGSLRPLFKMKQKPIKRIGVFGGSFDPVHIGHLTVAQDAFDQLDLDRLIFIPAWISPHKQDRHPIDGKYRLEMLKLATKDDFRFDVSDIEITRGGVSYSFDTIQQVKVEYPNSDVFFIIGLDTVVDLHRWYRVDELFESCTVIPFGRGGESPEEVAERSELTLAWKVQLLDRLIRIHEIEVSASEIRMRIAEGLSVQTLVPSEIEMYITEHHLYN